MCADRVEDETIVILKVSAASKGSVTLSAVVHERVAPSVEESIANKSNQPQLHRVRIFQFLDDDRLSSLDAFLVQLGVKLVHLPENCVSNSNLVKVLENQNVDSNTLPKGHMNNSFDSLEYLREYFTPTSPVLKVESERKECIPLLCPLLELLDWRSSIPDKTLIELVVDSPDAFMSIDSAAAEAVNMFGGDESVSNSRSSLHGMLSTHCRTKLGPRTLARWLRQPLLNLDEINGRLDVVEAFMQLTLMRNSLREGPLKAVPDIEPALNKLRKNIAGLPELFRMYLFARAVVSMSETLGALQDETSGCCQSAHKRLHSTFSHLSSALSVFLQLVEHVLDLNALPDLRIHPNHDADLQALALEESQLQTEAEREFKRVKESLSSADNLRLEQSTQHGLVFRSPRADDERALRESSHIRVSVLSILKNGVHFTTKALSSIAERLMEVQRDYAERQEVVVVAAMQTACSYVSVFESAVLQVSALDALQAMATHAACAVHAYVRPVLTQGCDEEVVFRLVQARHPCVELADHVHFIANDCDLSHRRGAQSEGSVRGSAADIWIKGDEEVSEETSPLALVTGPNMGGKSTYIRTAGCIAVLAHIGCFVPCESCEMSLVDRLFARVGAGDMQQRGVSTFMAEMLESSTLLRRASRQSLVLVDELGRGTSTFDGFGLAASIARYLATSLCCRTLFATHFHELTRLRCARNLHVSAVVEGEGEGVRRGSETEKEEVRRGGVTMLYEVRKGACLRSFGVHVAQMAAFPSQVLNEAKRKARALERSDVLLENTPVNTASPAENQEQNKEGNETERAAKRLRGDVETVSALSHLLAAHPSDKEQLLRDLKSSFPPRLLVHSHL